MSGEDAMLLKNIKKPLFLDLNNMDIPFEQEQTKAQKTSDFKMNTWKQRFYSETLRILDPTWLLGLTNFYSYNLFLNISDKFFWKSQKVIGKVLKYSLKDQTIPNTKEYENQFDKEY